MLECSSCFSPQTWWQRNNIPLTIRGSRDSCKNPSFRSYQIVQDSHHRISPTISSPLSFQTPEIWFAVTPYYLKGKHKSFQKVKPSSQSPHHPATWKSSSFFTVRSLPCLLVMKLILACHKCVSMEVLAGCLYIISSFHFHQIVEIHNL